MFGFLYILPIPIIGAFGGGKAVKDVASNLEDIVTNFLFFQYFIFFLILSILVFFGIKFYKLYFKSKFKKLLMMLYRLDTELLLFKRVGEVEAKKKLAINLSREESITRIHTVVDKKYFIKRAGLHNYERIVDALDIIKNDKVDIDTQIALVDNFIRIVESLTKSYI